MANLSKGLCAILTCFLLFSRHALAAEQVQFCKFGAQQFPEEAVDFCVSLSAQQNYTSNSHDVYIALSVTRAQSQATGWTAIGIGSAMKGSLMFVIYGDPLNSAAPVVSVRTAGGYVRPEDTSVGKVGGVKLETLESSWEFSDGSAMAKVMLACYACTAWPSSIISASDSSQPWIWAWNKDQVFQEFSDTASPDSHTHSAESGGTGIFFVDMTKAVNSAVDGPPPRPFISQNVEAIGASEYADFESQSPAVPKSMRWFSRGTVHGMLMATAFFVVFPAGVVNIRSNASRSFKYHWALQLFASVLVLIGVAIGLAMSNRVSTTHQIVGIGLTVCLSLQGILGWRHHVHFVKTQRQNWVSGLHVYFGKPLMIVGWGNLLSGLSLAGFQKDVLLGVAVIECIEATALWLWVWSVGRRKSHMAGRAQARWGEDREGYFALTENDTDDEAERPSDGKSGGTLEIPR